VLAALCNTGSQHGKKKKERSVGIFEEGYVKIGRSNKAKFLVPVILKILKLYLPKWL
jgi:hypothetical protein